MDQVPLPFVVEQEHASTSHDDAHVHIRSCGVDGLTKRQCTMHIFVNAGDGQDGGCYVELIARGKGQCISQVEIGRLTSIVFTCPFPKVCMGGQANYAHNSQEVLH
jgi:hypothetical protein